MKIAVFFVSVIALGVLFDCAQAAANQSHHSFWGQTYWNSTRAYAVQVKQSSSFFSVITQDLQYPPPGIVNYRPIVAIRAFDQKTNGNGAYATIVSGGIYSNNVRLRFKSQRGHGINFIVEIFTR